MLRPKLRPVTCHEARVEGEQCVVLADAAGLSPRAAVMSRFALAVVALLDGERDLRDIQAELMRSSGALIPMEVIRQVVDRLDECLLLDSPAYSEYLELARVEYRNKGFRPALLAGSSYPEEPEELTRMLFGFLEAAGKQTDGTSARTEPLSALVVPHIDFGRGGPLYAAGYSRISKTEATPELLVILGIDHKGITDDLYMLTEMAYQTPLGKMEIHDEAASILLERMGPEILKGELAHANEHSIEFQAVWLRHLFEDGCPPALPVLCGSFHRFIASSTPPSSDPSVRGFAEALSELCRRYRTLIVVGADLSHVGPAFEDPVKVQGELKRSVRQADETFMGLVARGDADRVFARIAADGDRHKICGFPAIYTMLLALGGEGRGDLLAYDQCPADPEGTSWVGACAMSIRKRGHRENAPAKEEMT